MFFRTKTSGPRSYLQIVENRWEDGRTRQRVVATPGRRDPLQQDGRLDALLASGARLSQSVLLVSAHAQGQLPTLTARRIGPALIFPRLWQQTGCQRVIERLLDGRRFECDVERAICLTVLPRLFAPGSDCAADKWKTDYRIEGC
ncbi:MAG: transposase, partial [Acetobacteraceae bacterium]|nr:transposase [Acetobacteraceae bacterium]